MIPLLLLIIIYPSHCLRDSDQFAHQVLINLLALFRPVTADSLCRFFSRSYQCQIQNRRFFLNDLTAHCMCALWCRIIICRCQDAFLPLSAMTLQIFFYFIFNFSGQLLLKIRKCLRSFFRQFVIGAVGDCTLPE